MLKAKKNFILGCFRVLFWFLASIVVLYVGFLYTKEVPRGKVGQACYPNSTCDDPNTCFQVGDEQLCYKEIKPVMPPDSDFCYTLSENGLQESGETRCFNTMDECIKQFSLILQKTTREVVNGCSWK